MWRKVTEHIENVLWAGTLVPATDEAMEELRRELASSRLEGGAEDTIRNLPVVSVGVPEVWPLEEFCGFREIPRPLRAKLREADFYVVEMKCSFRSRIKQVEVGWARFLAHLLPDEDGNQPIAFDLYPKMVVRQVQRNVKVTLSPTLKFRELEAGGGGVDYGIEYTELQPIISASGPGEAKPSWDYSSAKGVYVQGCKFMHMLVKAPKGMPRGEAELDLVADVGVRNSTLPMLWPREEHAEPLTVQLWG